MTDPVSAAVFALRCAILLALVVAVRRRDVAAAVNAAVAFAVALLPVALVLVSGSSIRPELALWLGVAGLLHTIGMLGLYDSVWWWDHLTHLVSASLVAALFYAGFLADGVRVVGTPALATVLATFVVGLFWEFVELLARELGERADVEPMLVHYGRRDTLLDLIVDVAAAVLVVFADLRVFVSTVGDVLGTSPLLVLQAGAAGLLGTVLLAGLVVWLRLDR